MAKESKDDDEETRQKRIKKAQQKIKDGKAKISFASKVVTESLEEYTQLVLKSLANNYQRPGFLYAIITDRSTIGHFTGVDENIDDAAVLKKVSEDLEVAVSEDDYIWEVAKRLREKVDE